MAGEYPDYDEIDEAAMTAARSDFDDLDTREIVTPVYDRVAGQVVNIHHFPGMPGIKSIISTSIKEG